MVTGVGTPVTFWFRTNNENRIFQFHPMKKIQRSIFLLLVGIPLILTGCRNSETPAVIATESETSLPSPIIEPSLTSESVEVDVPRVTETLTVTPETADKSTELSYQFDVSLNYPDHSLTVIENIDYTNKTGETLTNLPLVVPPMHRDGVFSLLSCQADPPYDQSNAQMEGAVLNLVLQPALEPEESLHLSLILQLQVPESRSVLGYTDRQLLLADWFPFIPPYLEGSGWLVNEPGAVGEYLAYPLADFTVKLKLSPPMEGLVVAASTPATAVDGNCRTYQADQVRNISFAFSPEYVVYSDASDQVSVQAYVLPEHTSLGQRAAGLVKDAWTLYESLYTDNPRAYLSLIEADLEDGMEYDGTFFISDWYFQSADATPKNYFELLLVHETAHQWFYALIPNDPAQSPWLDESLATYSELLYLEANHPDLVDWWWGFRVDNFNPSGYVDSTIYDHSNFRPYVNAVYLRGVRFLEALRQKIGDEAFFSFLKAYSETNSPDHFRTTAAFFTLLRQYTDEDLSGLISSYFRSAYP